MVAIHPTQGEKFYLRMLLKKKRGATSYQDLRTVDGVVCGTYKQACIAMNLLRDDRQWKDCLSEATSIKLPKSLRGLFCNILVFCEPTEPEELYRLFRDSMKEDFLFRRRNLLRGHTEEQIQDLSINDLLIALQKVFRQYNKDNKDFGIPQPQLERQVAENLGEGEIDINAVHFYGEMVDKLNDGQRCVFETLKVKIDNNEGGFYNLDAPGGTGKTFLCNVLLAYVRKDKDKAIATALSGIAATLMTLGTTAHKRFGIPVPCLVDSSCSIILDSERATIIKQSKIIFIDEVSMATFKQIDCVNRF